MARGGRYLVLMLVVAGALLVQGHVSVEAATELTFWTFLNPTGTEPRGQLLAQIVEEFNSNNEDVNVNIESIHYSRIDQLAIQATAAGQGPDILNVYSVQLPQHVEAGTVLPLDDYIANLSWVENDYLFPIESVTYNSHVMSLPWELRAWVLYYRADILEQAGLRVPRTLEELRAAARSLSAPRRQGWVVGLSDRSLAAEFMETFEILLWAHGGTLLNDDGTAAFSDEAGYKVMEYLRSMYEDGAMTRSALSMTSDDVIEGLKVGTVVMSLEGSMQLAGIRSGLSEDAEIGIEPVPGLSNDVPAPALLAGQTVAIGANSRHRDEAWRFLEYFMSPEVQRRWLTVNVLPVRASAYSELDDASDRGKELLRVRNYALRYGRMTQYPRTFPQLSDILVKAAQRIVIEGAPIGRTLQEAAVQYNSLIR